MKKIIIISIFFLLLQSCGFTPIHSSNIKKDFYIADVSFIKSDNDLSNFIKTNLKKYSTQKGKEFNIKGTIQYSKNSISKNSTGKTEEYELSSLALLTINSTGTTKYLEIKENFKMNNFEDEFEERKYEKTIKQNMAQSITSKLIM